MLRRDSGSCQAGGKEEDHRESCSHGGHAEG